MKLQNLLLRLEKHHKKKLDLSLGRTFNLLKKLGNPQDKIQNIVLAINNKESEIKSLTESDFKEKTVVFKKRLKMVLSI